MLCALLIAITAQDVVTFRSLLEELGNPAALARWPSPEFHLEQTCGAEPPTAKAPLDNGSSGRGSAAFEEREGRREWVLLDAEGPGAIVRSFVSPVGTHLRVYLDSAETPSIDSNSLRWFDDGPHGQDRIAWRDRPSATSLLPIPFAKRVKITSDAERPAAFHFAWRRYRDGTSVESLGPDTLGQQASLLRLTLANLASRGSVGERALSLSLAEPNPDGFLQALDPALARGPRAVSELDFLVESPDLDAAVDALWLEMTFDEVITVAVPFGAFFASRPGVREVETRPIEVMPPGRFVARWTMPYRERFDMRIVNQGSKETHVSGSVRTVPWDWDERSLYFHASWRRARSTSGAPRSGAHTAEIAGRGVLVGEVLFIASAAELGQAAGTDRVRVEDEDDAALYVASPAEAFGLCFEPRGTFQGAFATRTSTDPAIVALARWRALDATPFGARLVRDLELDEVKYGSVELDALVVWYGDLTSRAIGATDAPAERIKPFDLRSFRRPGALEAERARVVAAAESVVHDVETIAAKASGRWSSDAQLRVRVRATSGSIELEFPVDRPGKREVIVYPAKGPDYGLVRFRVDGTLVDRTFDGWSGEGGGCLAPTALSLGTFGLGSTLRLTLELVAPEDPTAPPRSVLGLDAIELR